jgi:alpha-L-arabinofuranosidase
VKFLGSIRALCLKDYDLALISKALVQIVNFESVAVQVTICTTGLQASIDVLRSTATVLTSSNVMDENSFSNPNKVIYNFSVVHKMAYQMFYNLQSSWLVLVSLFTSSSESRAVHYSMVQVSPVKSQLFEAGAHMQVTLAPHSFTSFDLALAPSKLVTLAGRVNKYLMSELWDTQV